MHVSRFYANSPWLFVACALAACGGSGDSGQVFTKLDELNAGIGNLRTTYPADSFTPFGELPDGHGGSTTYRGYLSTQFGLTSGENTAKLISAMEVHVSFGVSNEMVTGSAHSFVDEDSTSLAGELTLSGGTLSDVEPELDAMFRFKGQGELTDALNNTLIIQLAFDGDFLGDGAAALGGDVNGRVVVNEAESEDLVGLFITERESP